jgi:hypothetical protein
MTEGVERKADPVSRRRISGFLLVPLVAFALMVLFGCGFCLTSVPVFAHVHLHRDRLGFPALRDHVRRGARLSEEPIFLPVVMILILDR